MLGNYLLVLVVLHLPNNTIYLWSETFHFQIFYVNCGRMLKQVTIFKLLKLLKLQTKTFMLDSRFLSIDSDG